MLVVIKTQREPSTRLLLELIDKIRNDKGYEYLTYLKSLDVKEGKKK